MTHASSANLFTALTGSVVAFQLALVAGAPWGGLTQGGRVSGALPIGAVGTCRFEVNGEVFDSVPSDPFTTVSHTGDNYSVQCVATIGDTRHTINLAFTATGPGATPPGLGQYSTQPATGGTAEQYRAFDAAANMRDVSSTAIAGTSNFVAKGSSDKRVSVAFHLPLR